MTTAESSYSQLLALLKDGNKKSTPRNFKKTTSWNLSNGPSNLSSDDMSNLIDDEDILSKEERNYINEFLDFVNNSPSPFHAVATIIKLLHKSDFIKISEKEDWSKLKTGRYYFTRNQSTIVSFVIPNKWKSSNGFTIMAAHTDSPCLKVKPKSKIKKSGSLQVGVETYGGGLWNTWFDRDLSIAGRVIVRKVEKTDDDNKSNESDLKYKNEKFVSSLVKINEPILRISNLAIHLNRDIYSKGFQFNRESNTIPTLATEAALKLNEKLNDIQTQLHSNNSEEDNSSSNKLLDDCHPLLIHLLLKSLKLDSIDEIEDFDLCLYDTQKSRTGGILKEFIYSARLDNLLSCFICLNAFIKSLSNISNEKNIRMFAAFDNEEVGSKSNRGAGSNLLISTMKRLNRSNMFEASMQKSILVSCDMAHAIHPNYSNKHESNHQPKLHEGLVIKYNSNQRYATTMVSTFHLQELAKKLKIPLQKFVVRNDMPCGSTIGPMLSSNCGIRTVDVGCPQLSMHSIREVCGVKDVCTSTRLFTSFYENFVTLDEALTVD